MAIKAITVAGTAEANTRTNFLSPPIRTPFRPLALIVQWNASNVDDSFSVFLTRSDTPVSEPQPGDPPTLGALDLKTVVTAGTTFSVPITTTTKLEPPLRLALSYNNTDATTSRTVQAILFYDDGVM